jgi:serine/threonine-protein kinase CHEK2
MAQQIKMGRFDYPSPYWDPIGDPALDLIDRMLTVDADKRITIDECLEHPWVRNAGNYINPADSTDGLTGAMNGLDFTKRKVQRQRTLLAEINDIKVSKVVPVQTDGLQGQPGKPDVKTIKIWEKNPDGKTAMTPRSTNKESTKPDSKNGITNGHEEHPASNRQEDEFMQMGGRGDMPLFLDDDSSRYLPEEVPP